MFAMFLIATIAAPQPGDVDKIELTRVTAPYISYARDGRAFVEFAPTVETRNVTCKPVENGVFECIYEARVKDFFTADFTSWLPKRERIELRDNRWQIVAPD